MPGLRVGWIVAPTKQIARIWRRHDYTTLTPGVLSDALTAVAMQPHVRENILVRTRAIIRANLPHLEAWIDAHRYFTYVRPVAGSDHRSSVARRSPACAPSSTSISKRWRSSCEGTPHSSSG